MKTSFLLLMVMLLICGNIFAADSISVPEYLQSITVKLNSQHSSGTGIVLTRKDAKGNIINVIWTCSHVVQNPDFNQTEPSLYDLFSMGPPETNHEYLTLKAEKINITTNVTHLVKASDETKGNDLAVLISKGSLITTNTVHFRLTGEKPLLGQDVYSEGCPYGEPETFSKGCISHIDNVIQLERVKSTKKTKTVKGKSYDQTTCVIYPGSSGGGIYTTDGECIGISVMMAAPGMNYIIPARRIVEWAKEQHIEWAIDPNVPMPSDADLKKLKIGD